MLIFGPSLYWTKISRNSIVLLITLLMIAFNPGRTADCGLMGRRTQSKVNYTRLLVGGPGYSPFHNTVEIIELSNPLLVCEPLENFPFYIQGPVGGLNSKNEPMICGGMFGNLSISDDCHVYRDNEWMKENNLNKARGYAAWTRTPSNELFISGGLTEMSSLEVLTSAGWSTFEANLPIPLAYHCMVLIDDANVMLIGGSTGEHLNPSAKTFTYNFDSKAWKEGPSLSTPRQDVTCGLVKKSEGSDEKVVIVTGQSDYSGSQTETEVLDLASQEWRMGPTLPLDASRPVMIEESSGSVVLVGGFSHSSNYDNIFRLPHAESEWQELPQRLSTERNHHIAFFVPDEHTKCTPDSNRNL